MYSTYWKGQSEPEGNLSNPYLQRAQNWPSFSPAEANAPKNYRQLPLSPTPTAACLTSSIDSAFSQELLATKASSYHHSRESLPCATWQWDIAFSPLKCRDESFSSSGQTSQVQIFKKNQMKQGFILKINHMAHMTFNVTLL